MRGAAALALAHTPAGPGCAPARLRAPRTALGLGLLMAKGAGVETVRSCPDLWKTVTISHVLPALIRPLMSQAPLIADFTRFRPIVDLHRRGFDSSGQAPGRGEGGVKGGRRRREGGKEEGKKKKKKGGEKRNM